MGSQYHRSIKGRTMKVLVFTLCLVFPAIAFAQGGYVEATYNIVSNIVTVECTTGSDEVMVKLEGNKIKIFGSGQFFSTDFTLSAANPTVIVRGYDGNDTIAFDRDSAPASAHPKFKVYAGPGTDFVFGTDNADWIEGGPGNDYIWGYGGVDILIGDGGDDTISSGTGDDYCFGGAAFGPYDPLNSLDQGGWFDDWYESFAYVENPSE